mmetsp:Transcript_10595/g.19111  ORF Transcript_10595/g.19111 Transcript_10595/m.19111 type:complete len:96 (-) Transcript_10595:325-612(-)
MEVLSSVDSSICEEGYDERIMQSGWNWRGRSRVKQMTRRLSLRKREWAPSPRKMHLRVASNSSAEAEEVLNIYAGLILLKETQKSLRMTVLCNEL